LELAKNRSTSMRDRYTFHSTLQDSLERRSMMNQSIQTTFRVFLFPHNFRNFEFPFPFLRRKEETRQSVSEDAVWTGIRCLRNRNCHSCQNMLFCCLTSVAETERKRVRLLCEHVIDCSFISTWKEPCKQVISNCIPSTWFSGLCTCRSLSHARARSRQRLIGLITKVTLISYV
jgi:hypothetical protein